MISRGKQGKFSPVPGIPYVVARDLNLTLLGEKPVSNGLNYAMVLLRRSHCICSVIIKPGEVRKLSCYK